MESDYREFTKPKNSRKKDKNERRLVRGNTNPATYRSQNAKRFAVNDSREAEGDLKSRICQNNTARIHSPREYNISFNEKHGENYNQSTSVEHPKGVKMSKRLDTKLDCIKTGLTKLKHELHSYHTNKSKTHRDNKEK